MRLELENVGKVSSADIELNGITVIAGENNTGKSTIGKMLFCVFHAFYRIEEQIRNERIKSISRVLTGFYHEITNRFQRRLNTIRLAEQIVDQKGLYSSDRQALMQEIEDYFVGKDEEYRTDITRESLERIAKRICLFLAMDDGEIRKIILQKRLEAEFAMNVGHLNHADQKANVKLIIRNDRIDFSVEKNEEINIADYLSLNKEIIYIDDPFVLDDLGKMYLPFVNEFEHRNDLLSKLSNDRKAEQFSVIDELIVQKKLEKIFDIMGDVCDGTIVAENGESYIYKTDRLDGNLKMVNLSTGMKSFVILRRLLQNGNIDENGIIILDEPEIHLHPEWQLKFAEIIVLIQKEFHTNILLNTHSPYFLNAIEVYSEKYGIDRDCKYYLADDENGITTFADVTDQAEKIYAKLARPLQELENLEYED